MNFLNGCIIRMWNKLLELDGVQATYVHGQTNVPLTVIVEDMTNESMMVSAAVRRGKVCQAFTLRKSDIGFDPEKGDEVHLQGKRFVLYAESGEKIWRWADTTEWGIVIQGYLA